MKIAVTSASGQLGAATVRSLKKIVDSSDVIAMARTRERADAYARVLTDDRHNGQIYSLAGPAITQHELVDCLNEVFGTTLHYEAVSVEAYRRDRTAELGEFMGTIIAGIYQGIRNGAMDVPSDYPAAAGREHISIREAMRRFREGAAE
ncbi:hypothetical protein [Lewinella sp. JB7]|uniref:hypothetical protein n=1 Tax=Lewinella sp. JB7 TaxID=2962887 RepID=UPI0020C973E8|nr:hypothetical protein [Lewinella sp. JB7]MCP9234849.1 hypothetical protein [Lewinella sp. JB7]